jgi:hypothetical protein
MAIKYTKKPLKYQMAIKYTKRPLKYEMVIKIPNGQKIPNGHKIYQRLPFQEPPKFTQIGIF